MKIRSLALASATIIALSGLAFAETASPQPAKTLVVFFDFDKARLTQGSEQVISDAVRAVKQDGYAQG